MEHIEAFGLVRADNGELGLGVRVRNHDDPARLTRIGHLYVCNQFPPHDVGPAGGVVEFHPVEDQEHFEPLLDSEGLRENATAGPAMRHGSEWDPSEGSGRRIE